MLVDVEQVLSGKHNGVLFVTDGMVAKILLNGSEDGDLKVGEHYPFETFDGCVTRHLQCVFNKDLVDYVLPKQTLVNAQKDMKRWAGFRVPLGGGYFAPFDQLTEVQRQILIYQAPEKGL